MVGITAQSCSITVLLLCLSSLCFLWQFTCPASSQLCACADFSLLDRYLAQDKVREELGVGDRPWQSCSPDVYNDFLGKHCCRHGVVFMSSDSAGQKLSWRCRLQVTS